MKHIAALDQFGKRGGGQRILTDLAAFLLERQWRLDLFSPPGPLQDQIQAKGGTTQALHLPEAPSGHKSPMDYVRGAFWAKKAANKHGERVRNADLILVNGMRTLPLALRWHREFGIPLLLYLHLVYKGVPRRMIAWALKKEGIWAIAPSQITAQPFQPCHSVIQIANWVSPEFLTPPSSSEESSLREVFRIPREDLIVLLPGRISPHKGQQVALEAAKHFQKNIWWIFVGEPLFEKDAQDLARSLKQAQTDSSLRVRLVAWTGNMNAAYDGADVVLMPSLWEEPFGLVAVEAMARGIPVVVSNRGSLPNIAGHGDFAEVVEPDPRGISKALQAYMHNPSRWKERAVLAQKTVFQRFGPVENMGKVVSLMEEIIANRPSA